MNINFVKHTSIRTGYNKCFEAHPYDVNNINNFKFLITSVLVVFRLNSVFLTDNTKYW